MTTNKRKRRGKRDTAPVNALYRHCEILVSKREIADDGRLRATFRVSSETPIEIFSGEHEILLHREGTVRLDRLRKVGTLLVGHFTRDRAAKIEAADVVDGFLEITVLFGRSTAAKEFQQEFEDGTLRGVSVGFEIHGFEVDNDTRTITVDDWEPFEVSLTPVPADFAEVGSGRSTPEEVWARVRSAKTNNKPNSGHRNKDKTMNLEQLLKMFRGHEKLVKRMHEDGKTAEQIAAAVQEEIERVAREKATAANPPTPTPVIPPEPGPDESENVRKLRAENERNKVQLALRDLRDEHDVEMSNEDLAKFDSVEGGLRELMKRKVGAGTQSPLVVSPTQVTEDAADKFLRHTEASLLDMAKVERTEDDNKRLKGIRGGMRGLTMARGLAKMDGMKDADYVNELELAARFAGALDIRTFGRRDSANKIVAGFTTLLANVAHKALMSGLAGFNGSTWDIWCTQRDVPNFLEVTNAGLASGLLTETPENEAFPELNQKDGGYNSKLGIYGATISLSMQTIINDQLGQFMESLARIGLVASQTVDKVAFTRLLNGDYTNDTSAGTDLAADLKNLDKPRSALRNRPSPVGEKMGIIARFLLHDPLNARPSEEATGAIFSGGQVNPPSTGARAIQPIESQWVGDTGLFAGALTTDTYTTGDQRLYDTVLVNFLRGLGFSPMIAPYDPGAVAAEKWKVMLPFQATLATHADKSQDPNVTHVSAIQKGVAA